MNSDNLSDLIGLAYGSVDDDMSWEFFIDSMRSMLHADSALLFTPLNTPDEGGLHIRINTDEWSVRTYCDHYKDHDLWYAGSKARMLDQPGLVVFGEELVDEREFRKSEWLNDFLKPSKQCRLLGANVEVNVSLGGPAFMNFYKSDEASFFTEDDRAVVRLLLPHVQRAFRMRADHMLKSRKAELLEGALRANAHPYMVLDGRQRIAASSGSADEFLAAKDGIYTTTGGTLRCSLPEDDERLRRFLSGLLRERPLSPQAGGNVLLIDRPSGNGAVVLQAGTIERICKERYVLLSLVVLGLGQRRAPTLALRQLGLTGAEARLAAVIGAGVSPVDAAAELGISEGNVRTALKKIFSKLGISRQSELAVLVTQIAQGQVAR